MTNSQVEIGANKPIETGEMNIQIKLDLTLSIVPSLNNIDLLYSRCWFIGFIFSNKV